MYKFGLKLWSINTDYYYEDAKKLYAQGIFDYIELYVVPNTVETLSKWGKLNIPFTLHAPHFVHGVNLADSEKFEYNKFIYEQVKVFQDRLNAQYTIVHGGIEGDIDETIRQLKIIKPKNLLIENKPYVAPLGEHKLCRGYCIEEILKLIKELDCGFCLDVGHAICAANSLKLEPYSFVEDFNSLNPTCYHLSDGIIDNEMDKHLNFGNGNYDIRKIFGIIDISRNISIETQKKTKSNLNDFKEDINYIKILK